MRAGRGRGRGAENKGGGGRDSCGHPPPASRRDLSPATPLPLLREDGAGPWLARPPVLVMSPGFPGQGPPGGRHLLCPSQLQHSRCPSCTSQLLSVAGGTLHERLPSVCPEGRGGLLGKETPVRSCPGPGSVQPCRGQALQGGDRTHRALLSSLLSVQGEPRGSGFRNRLADGGVYSTVGFACVAMTTVRLASVRFHPILGSLHKLKTSLRLSFSRSAPPPPRHS